MATLADHAPGGTLPSHRAAPRSIPLVAPFVASLLAGCSGSPPDTLGSLANGLTPCPATPNCVHTGARHPAGTPPVRLAEPWVEAPSEELLAELARAVESLPRTAVTGSEVAGGPGGGVYLRAESRSLVLRFVDDLELRKTPGGRELEVRSAARVGRSDLGVNARRVDALRELLVERGVVER